MATAKEQLWDVALDQHGYVAFRDAARLGIDNVTIRMLVARGQLAHVAHGVYRFPQLPASAYDPQMLAVLWTGAKEAALSHDSALSAYEVCDINPDRIHVTVSKRRRIRRAGGELYVVHYQDLEPGQIGWWQQIPTATLPAAVAQCIASGVPGYLLRQALTAGRARGELSEAQRGSLARELDEREQL